MKLRLESMGFGAFYGLLLSIVVWSLALLWGVFLNPLILFPLVIVVMGAVGFALRERFVENFGGLVFWTMFSI